MYHLIELCPHRERLTDSFPGAGILMFRKAGHGGQGPLHELKDFADGVFFRPPAEPVTSAFSADAFQKTAGHHILDNDFEVFL